MKKYIRATTTKPNHVEISIDFVYEISDSILCATDTPGIDDDEIDNLIQMEAMEDVSILMDLVKKKLASAGYDILDGPRHSNNEDSNSFYMSICDKDESDALAITFILHIRVSDHRLSRKKEKNGYDRFQARKDYYDSLTPSFKELNENPDAELLNAFKEIIIGKTKCKNIITVVNHICNEVKKYL